MCGSHALFTGPASTFFNKFFFKIGSHGTIHTFKSYFVTVFSVFNNKRYPNKLYIYIALNRKSRPQKTGQLSSWKIHFFMHIWMSLPHVAFIFFSLFFWQSMFVSSWNFTQIKERNKHEQSNSTIYIYMCVCVCVGQIRIVLPCY